MRNMLNEMSVVYRSHVGSSDILFAVQDAIGPVYKWPTYVRKIINSTTLTYEERMKLTAFLYLNGWRDSAKWIQLVIRIKGPEFQAYTENLLELYKYYGTERGQQYFSYCVRHKRQEYLNGRVRNVNK